jgi:hypothetical protein
MSSNPVEPGLRDGLGGGARRCNRPSGCIYKIAPSTSRGRQRVHRIGPEQRFVDGVDIDGSASYLKNRGFAHPSSTGFETHSYIRT